MEEKVEYIIREVRDLYVKKGIKNVTMDDVAAHLGMSKKTLYQYFSDKDQLVEKALLFHVSEYAQHFMSLMHQRSNAIEKLYEVSRVVEKIIGSVPEIILNDLKKYYPEVLQRFIDYKRQHILKNVSRNVKSGIKEGLYRKDLNPDIVSRSYLALSESFIDAENYDDYTAVFVFNELFMYHIRGIASEKGIAYIEDYIKKHKSKK